MLTGALIATRLVLPAVRLCFSLAASPTDGFYGQLAMFRRALDALGGNYRAAAVTVTFGAEYARPPLPSRWVPHFERIETHAVDAALVTAHGHHAQLDERWRNADGRADFVIFADADTMLLRPVDDLLHTLARAPAIAGAIAHRPFPQLPGDRPRRKWRELALEFAGRPIPHPYEHTLMPPDAPESLRSSPFYVNMGFVIVPRELLPSLRKSYLGLRPAVAPRLRNPYFAGQVALTLAVHANDLPRHAIDLKYNFPNDPRAETMYPDSLRDIRVIHYLRTGHFDRIEIFASAESFDQFLALDLVGSERIFQDHVRALTNGHYPFR